MKTMKKFFSIICIALALCLSVSAGVSAEEPEWIKVTISLAFEYGENISYYHLVSADFKEKKDALYIEASADKCRMYDLDNDSEMVETLRREFELNKNNPKNCFFDRRDIVLLGDITYIGNESFILHTRVKDVYIPDNVERIGKNIFSNKVNPVIHCTNGSAAMKYALENNHAFDAEGFEGITGDLNCDNAMNMKDVLTLRKYIAGIRTKVNINTTDVNGDGAVNMKDVLKLRKLIAGIE